MEELGVMKPTMFWQTTEHMRNRGAVDELKNKGRERKRRRKREAKRWSERREDEE